MMTGKNLLFLLLFIPLMSIGQSINKTNDGYTEVVEVELTKQEIHQKINEWIAINYKSAQDVIQLNTEDKVILKGNFSADFRIQNFTFTYRIHNSLTFSIRDNKFKIDLVPNRASYEGFSTSSATTIGKDVDFFISQYLHPEYNKDDFLVSSKSAARKTFMSMGFSEKKIQKLIEIYSKETRYKEIAVVYQQDLIGYDAYLLNKSTWDNNIISRFTSIKDYVAQSNSDDDW